MKGYQENYKKELKKLLSKKTTEELQSIMVGMGYTPYPVEKRNSIITCIVNNEMAIVPIGTMVFNSLVTKQKLSSYYGGEKILEEKMKESPEFFSEILYN